MPKIIVQKNTEIIKTYNLPGKDVITIGSSSGCDVPIEDPAVAAEQAKLVLKDDGFHLQLVTHIPPVFVTEERVEGDVKLEDGDTVRIEEYNLILNILDGEIKVVEEPPPPPPPPEPKPEPKPEPEPSPPAEQKKDVIQDAINGVLKEKERLSESDAVRLPSEQEAQGKAATPPPEPKPEPKPEPPPPPKPEPPSDKDISIVKTEELTPEPEEPVQAAPAAPASPPKPKPAPPPPPEPEPVREEPSQPDDRKTKVLPTMGSALEAQPSTPTPPVRRKKDKYLLAISGPHKGEQFKLKETSNSIGRDRQKNDIVVRLGLDGSVDKSISRQHALIEFRDDRFLLSDKGSQMRTKLNGRTISTSDVLPVGVGDLIEICSMKEGTVFRLAEEGRLDFSPPHAEPKPVSFDLKNKMPLIIIGAVVVIVIIILIFLFK